MRRPSPSPASSAPICSSSCGRWSRNTAPRSRSGSASRRSPIPYVLERGDELAHGDLTAAELARHFPTPLLADVGDEIADGAWDSRQGEPRPLALFDAVRVDYSLRRLVHYTGTDWRTIQPWILLTNYHRYVDQFVRWGLEQLAPADGVYDRLVLPGGVVVERGDGADADGGDDRRGALASLPDAGLSPDRAATTSGGITLVNIGVGPSNAKTITDHLAVLRPHCWLMVGHCGGLRQSQTIGDYVLAHGYLRRDRILDDARAAGNPDAGAGRGPGRAAGGGGARSPASAARR